MHRNLPVTQAEPHPASHYVRSCPSPYSWRGLQTFFASKTTGPVHSAHCQSTVILYTEFEPGPRWGETSPGNTQTALKLFDLLGGNMPAPSTTLGDATARALADFGLMLLQGISGNSRGQNTI